MGGNGRVVWWIHFKNNMELKNCFKTEYFKFHDSAVSFVVVQQEQNLQSLPWQTQPEVG